MPAYLFIKTRISDPPQYQKYVEAVRPLAATHGSRFIVRSRPVEVLEGSPEAWGDHLLLVSEFPSLEAARTFWTSAEYAAVRRLREGAGEVHVVLTEALPAVPEPTPSPASAPRTRYLNTDLDLVSAEDLTPLAAALEAGGLFALHAGRREDGLWYASLETEADHDEPEASITAVLAAVESLPDPARAVWARCTRRELNIGYDCGAAPWAFEQGLSSAVLARVAALGASLRITLYPARSDEAAASR